MLSQFKLLFAVAGVWPCCQVDGGSREAGEGEVVTVCVGVGSRRPLAVLAIGSENRGNVGQLCHPFEVGTACL